MDYFGTGTPAGHDGSTQFSVTSVALSADGRRAISNDGERTLRVRDVDTAMELRVIAGCSGDFAGVALSGDGRRAVSASSWSNPDKTLIIRRGMWTRDSYFIRWRDTPALLKGWR